MKDASLLLPIGSIVLLNGGTKKVMVTGFYTVNPEEPNNIYDYSGCTYPEGILVSTQTLLFNHNQIVEVIHEGYKDEEDAKFKEILGSVHNNEQNQ